MVDLNLRWLNRVKQDHEARASDFSRKFFFIINIFFKLKKAYNRNKIKDDIYNTTDTKKNTNEQINTNNNVTRLNIGQ